MSEKPPVVVKRAYRDGCVGLLFHLRVWDRGSGVRMDGGTDLTTAQARALARSLIELADQADAKVAAKAAADERRRKWRDREIAAGRRMKVLSVGQLFRRP